MRPYTSIILSLLILFTTTSALAESINGRFGLTGKLGALVPLKDSDISGIDFETSTGFTGGGGVIYGFGNNLAAELEVSHTPSMDVEIGGNEVAEAELTDISFGIVYRLMTANRLVPYIGGGVDAIRGDISDSKLDWTVGGHARAGVDYFLYRRVALNADMRYIFAAKSDIEQNGVKVGEFDPMSFVATIGVKLFLPDDL